MNHKKAIRHKPNLCETCGEEIGLGISICPYCETRQNSSVAAVRRVDKIKTVNIKENLPTVAEALSALHREIINAQCLGIKVIKIIHGYGSSGKGGAIKPAILDELHKRQRAGKIKGYISGEEFGSLDETGRPFIRQFGFLKDDHDFNKRNRGITVVLV